MPRSLRAPNAGEFSSSTSIVALNPTLSAQSLRSLVRLVPVEFANVHSVRSPAVIVLKTDTGYVACIGFASLRSRTDTVTCELSGMSVVEDSTIGVVASQLLGARHEAGSTTNCEDPGAIETRCCFAVPFP